MKGGAERRRREQDYEQRSNQVTKAEMQSEVQGPRPEDFSKFRRAVQSHQQCKPRGFRGLRKFFTRFSRFFTRFSRASGLVFAGYAKTPCFSIF
jgi:hypothetical protein